MKLCMESWTGRSLVSRRDWGSRPGCKPPAQRTPEPPAPDQPRSAPDPLGKADTIHGCHLLMPHKSHEESRAVGRDVLLVLESLIKDPPPALIPPVFLTRCKGCGLLRMLPVKGVWTRGYSQSSGSEFVRCFLNCSFRSLLTPMSWNIRCSLEVYSKPQACCKKSRQAFH